MNENNKKRHYHYSKRSGTKRKKISVEQLKKPDHKEVNMQTKSEMKWLRVLKSRFK